MTAIIICALIGLLAGIMGGMFGVGGGIVIVPMLIYFLGYNQKMAQGTSLVVFLVPVGILSVMNYYKANQVNLTHGFWIAGFLFVGAFFGSKIALDIDEGLLRKMFACLLILVGIQLFFKK